VNRIKEKCHHLPPLKLPSEKRKNVYSNASDEHWGAGLNQSTSRGFEEICIFLYG
jgi:hypothetical protein